MRYARTVNLSSLSSSFLTNILSYRYVTRQLDHAFAQPYDQTLYDFSLTDLFDRVHTLAINVIPRDDPAMLIPVLVHLDSNNRNIMIKDATVSGILDWEVRS